MDKIFLGNFYKVARMQDSCYGSSLREWMELAHDRVQAEVLGSNIRELVLDFEQCGNAI
jgi:hypothetical protein